MNIMFNQLLDISDLLMSGEAVEWTEPKGEGTIDNPLVLGRPVYSNAVRKFIETVYEIEKQCPELELKRYIEVLEENKISDINKLTENDISKLNLQTVMAILFWIIRGERFCDGLIMNKIEDGSVNRLLTRLKIIIEEET